MSPQQTPRWQQHGDDAAVLARAILDGTVTRDPKTFKDFFGPDSTGPGQALGLKYNFADQKGQQNLRLNWIKLLKKIELWKKNQNDPDSGKRKFILANLLSNLDWLSQLALSAIRFPAVFLRKAGFPERPELSSEVQNAPSGFNAGSDEIYEDVIRSEREEADISDDEEFADGDSLTVHEAGHEASHETDDESVEEIDEEQIPSPIMAPTKIKFAAAKEPNKQPGQCEVSWEILQPLIATVYVDDPSQRRRKGQITRKAIVVRVDIPAGVVPRSFVPEVSDDGTKVIFSCHMEKSRYTSDYTLGRTLLNHGIGLKVGFQKACQEKWTHVIEKCNRSSEGGEQRDYKRYTLILPEPCEQDLRDPCTDWEMNEVGVKGSTVKIDEIRSTFYYFGMFTIASKHVTAALASTTKLLRMEDVIEDHPMNSTNLAKSNYNAHKEMKTPARKLGHSRGRTQSPEPYRRNDRHRSKRSKSRRKKKKSKKKRSRRYSSSSSSSSSYSSESSISSSLESPSKNLSSSLKDMSICHSENLDSERRGSTRRRDSKDHHSSSHFGETTSQYRHRMKGKQRKVVKSVAEREQDRMNRQAMMEREEEIRKAYVQAEEARRQEQYEESRHLKDLIDRRKNIPAVVDAPYRQPEMSTSSSKTGDILEIEEVFSTPSGAQRTPAHFNFDRADVSP